MIIIPVKPIPNQSFNIVLLSQAATLNIYQLTTDSQTNNHLYMDILLNGIQIIGGVLCENRTLIIRNSYLGFQGDFMWVDTQTTTIDNVINNTYNVSYIEGHDPYYTDLGSRYILYYLSPYDVSYMGGVE